MKKLHLACAGLAALAGASAMTGCNPSAENETTHTEAAQPPAGGLKIAYVEIDSLMARYDFCKDYTILLNKKGENIRATLAGKERALQNKAAELQKKYETNQFTTKEQVEQAQMSLARQQQDMLVLRQQMDQRLRELEGAEKRMQELIRDARSLEDQKVRSLIQMYANMKPRVAAKALENMDERVAVRILSGMAPKHSGEILTYTNPEKTAKFTEIITRMRTP